jgi:hypothetical protein
MATESGYERGMEISPCPDAVTGSWSDFAAAEMIIISYETLELAVSRVLIGMN